MGFLMLLYVKGDLNCIKSRQETCIQLTLRKGLIRTLHLSVYHVGLAQSVACPPHAQ